MISDKTVEARSPEIKRPLKKHSWQSPGKQGSNKEKIHFLAEGPPDDDEAPLLAFRPFPLPEGLLKASAAGGSSWSEPASDMAASEAVASADGPAGKEEQHREQEQRRVREHGTQRGHVAVERPRATPSQLRRSQGTESESKANQHRESKREVTAPSARASQANIERARETSQLTRANLFIINARISSFYHQLPFN